MLAFDRLSNPASNQLLISIAASIPLKGCVKRSMSQSIPFRCQLVIIFGRDTVLRHLRQSPHEEENSLDPEGGDTSHSDTEESPSTSQLRAQAQHDLKNTYNAVDSSSHLMGVSDDDDGYPPQHDLASSIGRVHCKYPGCSHSYLRAEHLTRHHLTRRFFSLVFVFVWILGVSMLS